jgi:hypothetical protein
VTPASSAVADLDRNEQTATETPAGVVIEAMAKAISAAST